MIAAEPSAPTAAAGFYKGHGLGNDYLVFEEGGAWALTPGAVGRVCDRYRGLGGDGIVLLGSGRGEVPRLRMFNPDGSEFERSGNGLRILASYLARRGRVDTAPFHVEVGGDRVTLTVHSTRGLVHDVSVAMGRARVGPGAIRMDESILGPRGHIEGPDGELLDVVPVSVGNPHLVVFTEALADEDLGRIGPFLTAHPALAAGANVQLTRVVGPGACRALIWERGVGRTSASGTSSCAVAVAAVSKGLVPPGAVTVHMDGGDLQVNVKADLEVVLRGPVEEVCEGVLTEGFVGALTTL
ncbi:MAG TPA: diaminopimelate epimerase [Longimicrobiales bacterium]|nr:diaminopimelate epimerase [Longimicrobiales bacterium]